MKRLPKAAVSVNTGAVERNVAGAIGLAFGFSTAISLATIGMLPVFALLIGGAVGFIFFKAMLS